MVKNDAEEKTEITDSSENAEPVLQMVTFRLGDQVYGINVLQVQEVLRVSEISPVPGAPEYVLGIINLRGKIVTVIDTGKLLGLNPITKSDDMRTIIVNTADESVGLMVDRIGNVVAVEPGDIDAPPANIGDIPGRCFDAVFKTKNQLVGLLSVKTLFQ